MGVRLRAADRSVQTPTTDPALILLDREGVLLAHKAPYVLQQADVVVLPGAIAACRLLLRHGVRLAVVTNQSPIGRGLISADFVERTHAWLGEQIGPEAAGVSFHVCPHVGSDACECRKPKPGLLLHAMSVHGARPHECWMVGDHDTDMAAAAAAGVERRFHVTSGRQSTPSRLAMHVAHDLWTLVDSQFGQRLQRDGRRIRTTHDSTEGI
jgi:D-glycero-D-manno-heptose 1,7-bisphosphate phosphatase